MGSNVKKNEVLENKAGLLFKVKNLLSIYTQFSCELYFIK